MRARYRIDGRTHEVLVTRGAGSALTLEVDGRRLPLQHERLADGRWRIVLGGREHLLHAVGNADAAWVALDGAGAVEIEREAITHAGGGAGGAGSDVIVAPMPGVVIAVHVAAGDTVRAGQPLVVIESMKLETTLAAPRDARVKAVHQAAGASFALKAALVTLEDLEAAPGSPR